MFDLSEVQKRERFMRFFYNWFVNEERPKLREEGFYMPPECQNTKIEFQKKVIDTAMPISLRVELKAERTNYFVDEDKYYYPCIYLGDVSTQVEICKWLLAYLGFDCIWNESVYRRTKRVINDFIIEAENLPGYDVKFGEIPIGYL